MTPVERLWLYLRQRYWPNRVSPDIEAVEEAAVSGWRAIVNTGSTAGLAGNQPLPD